MKDKGADAAAIYLESHCFPQGQVQRLANDGNYGEVMADNYDHAIMTADQTLDNAPSPLLHLYQ